MQNAALNELMRQGMASLNAGMAAPAEQAFSKVLRRDPKNFAAANLLAIALMQRGRFREAEINLKLAISLNAGVDATFSNYGFVLQALKRPAEALAQFERALRLNPSNPLTWANHGSVLNELKRFDDAIVSFDKAIALDRGFAEALCNKGNALSQLKRFDEASEAYDQALRLKQLPDAWLGRANILSILNRNSEALAAYDKAISLAPALASAWSGRGAAYSTLGRHEEALEAYDKALSLHPDLVEGWNGKGNVLRRLSRHDEAMNAYDRALALDPDLAEAWLGRGNTLSDLKNFTAAGADYQRAIALDPGFAEAWFGLGFTRLHLKNYLEAHDAIERAFAINPDVNNLRGVRLHLKMQMCRWDRFEDDFSDLISAARSGKIASTPFVLAGLPSTSEDQLNCAKSWIVQANPVTPAPLWHNEIYGHERIRVCYLSSDFYKHAVAYCVADLFESHDASRFDISAISTGPDDKSAIRDRIRRAFPRFIDARSMDDLEIAAWIKNAEIDILVDLVGLTEGARTGVFSKRCAPIQISYLGYPGTMGTRFYDYLIADRTLIADHETSLYMEKIVYLPDSYQANDTKRECSEKSFTRAECGLPEQGFVFCCFNNSWKILPDVFDLWMSILRDVDGSVLWLVGDNPVAVTNLKQEATIRGVDPKRLVFADRIPIELHRSRQRLADLFLDTLPYNAHGTASDALWMGVPVLTQRGKTFAGRVAASLLAAVGLPELVTHSRESYRQLAVELATQPGKLTAIREKLARNRAVCPLFDTSLFTRHLERAYTLMYENLRAGADHIYVEN